MRVHDVARWHCRWRLAKWAGEAVGDPDEVIEGEGNMLLTAGIAALWNAACVAGTKFDNANARIAVGTGLTAADPGQTDLIGVNARKAMDVGYPQVAGATVTFRATYGLTEANFDWNEFGVANAASGGAMLNRKQVALGTKVGGTWQLIVSITLA